MFLVGKHLRQLDRKSRLAIPAEYLNRLPPDDRVELFMAPGRQGCVWLVPKSYWEQEVERFAAAYESEVPNEFYHHCQLRSIDKAGRVLVDGQLRDLAGLPDPSEGDKVAVMVCGSGRYLQLWSADAYERLARSATEFARSVPLGSSAGAATSGSGQ